MASRTDRVLKRDVRARVDRNTIILVVDVCAGDDHVRAGADIKAIGVLTEGISSLVVDGHAGDGQSVRIVDRDSLHGGVLDVKVCDGRVCKIMGVEELGLRDASRPSFAVPPKCPVAIQIGSRGARDFDSGTFDLQKRPAPFGVGPGGFTFENDLESVLVVRLEWRARMGGGRSRSSSSKSAHGSIILEIRQVQRHPGGHTQGGQDDGRTALLRDTGKRVAIGARECAASSALVLGQGQIGPRSGSGRRGRKGRGCKSDCE